MSRDTLDRLTSVEIDIGLRAPLPQSFGVDPPRAELRDRARAALLCGAIGDALGRPGEAKPRSYTRAQYGMLTDYQQWRGWKRGPIGTITDDTQLTMVMAHALLAGAGTIEPDHLVSRLLAWWPQARGIGRATDDALRRLAGGQPWFAAGSRSSGNGAAMRAAPFGIIHRNRLDRLFTESIVAAVPTHLDEVGALAAVAQAAMVASCLQTPHSVDPRTRLLADLETLYRSIPDPARDERHHRRLGERVRLGERLLSLGGLLDRECDEILDHFYNGAYVIESLPVAVWIYLRYVDDPEQGLVQAASSGRDSDTIAAMAGSLLGARHGTAWIPDRWRIELEHHDELVDLADALIGAGGD